MTSITEAAQSIDIEAVKAAGWILNDAIIYGFLLLAMTFLGENRREKRAKILLSIALAIIAGFLIKEGMMIDRPCVGEGWCPDGYSFPSIHAAAAFTLMTAFMTRKAFPLYLLFALFVAFTRLNIGVHQFQDIVAALPVALVSYYIAKVVIDNGR